MWHVFRENCNALHRLFKPPLVIRKSCALYFNTKGSILQGTDRDCSFEVSERELICVNERFAVCNIERNVIRIVEVVVLHMNSAVRHSYCNARTAMCGS